MPNDRGISIDIVNPSHSTIEPMISVTGIPSKRFIPIMVEDLERALKEILGREPTTEDVDRVIRYLRHPSTLSKLAGFILSESYRDPIKEKEEE